MKEKLPFWKAWRDCLQMWRWIVKEVKKTPTTNIWDAKRQWMKKYRPKLDLNLSCYFCEYNLQHGGDPPNDCHYCPGAIIDRRFHCEDIEKYNWGQHPQEFLRKLESLDRMRRKRKISVRERS